MSRYFFSSLRSRLLLLVLLSVVPALGLILYTALEQWRLATAQVPEHALRLTQIISSNQERLIEGARQLLVTVARLPEVQGGESSACSRLFADLLKQHSLYANFGAIKLNGDLFCSALPTDRAINLADRAYFQRAIKMRAFAIGDYQIGRATGMPSINFGYPILDDAGQIRSVIFAALDLSWLNRLVAEAQLPSGATLTVSDHKGTILARHPEPEKWVGKYVPEAPITEAIQTQGGEGTAKVTGMDGIPRLYAFMRLGTAQQNPSIYLSVGIPTKTVFADVDRILVRNLAGLAIVGVLAIAAAWVAGNLFVVQPVSVLVSTAKRLSTGDLGARTGLPYGRGELSLLASAFDEMADALQRRVAAQRAAETHFAGILSIAADAIIAINESQRIVLFNKGAEQIFGYRAEEVLGQPLDLLLPPSLAEVHREHIRSFAEAPETSRRMGEHREIFGRRRDGTEFPAEASISKLLQDGNATFTVILRDITERERAEEQIRHILERLRALQEINAAITSTLNFRAVLDILLEKIDLSLPYAAATVRLFNGASGLLEPVACRNLDEEEWKSGQGSGGRGFAEIVFATKAPMAVRDVCSDGRAKDLDFFRRHGLVSYLGIPLIAKNEAFGVLSFYTKEERDFTDEEIRFLNTLASQTAITIYNFQLYEQTKKQAADLAKSNRVKDEFLSIMSHELRTPLNVVMGYTAMVKDGIFGEVNPEQEKALQKVMDQSRDQLAMITSILQVTQMEAGEVKAERSEVELGDLLDEIRSSFDPLLDKEITLQWDYPSDLPVVNSDREKLRHILQSLIRNAIKFTDKGYVTVSAWYVAGAGRLQFKVADSGIGIPKEKLPVIFELFRQVDSSETRSYGGVGLGLHIVKKFTELLGGQVEVESEPGKGSTFMVTIPSGSHQYPVSSQRSALS
jgi:PAS domain S-box-containing protein